MPAKVQSKTLCKNLEAKRELVLNMYPTSELFAVEMNFDNCRKMYGEFSTSELALKSAKIKLRELSVIYSEREIIGWIQIWLIVLAKHMDFKIEPEQAEMTAIEILADMYMLNIAEFTLLFTRIKKGHYGIFYGKFNMQTILLACKQYRMERGTVLAGMNETEQIKYK